MRHAARPSTFKRWRGLIAVVAAAAVVGSGLTLSAVASASSTPPPDLLSKGKQVTASSIEGSHFAAKGAVDGDTTSRWSSAFRDRQWIKIDLGSPSSISKIVLNWERAYAKDFTIQTSADGVTWKTIAKVKNSKGGVETLNVSGSGRFVKLHATKRSGQYGVSLWELEVYGKVRSQPPAPAPTASPTPTTAPTNPPAPTATPTPTPTAAPTPTPSTSPGVTLPPQKPIPANAVRVAEFVAECGFSHRLPDDPIVFPKIAGASHLHSFFGNRSTDAHSTNESLMVADTTCNPVEDKSAYWTPTLLVDGKPVDPPTSTFYYLGEGVTPEIAKKIQPIPFGLRIIAGNAKATGPNDNAKSRWDCNGANVAPSASFVTCPPGARLQSFLDFPQCWDGKNLDSPDHKSHMSYPVHPGVCPATHPVPLPKLRQVVNYPVSGVDASRITLSSGPGYTYHIDFMNAWPEVEMERRVRDCINRIVKCGHDGNP